MGSPVVFSCDQSLHSRPAFLQTMISRSFSEDNRRWYVEHLFVTENNKSWMVLKQPCLKNNKNSTKKFRSHLKPDFNLVFSFQQKTWHSTQAHCDSSERWNGDLSFATVCVCWAEAFICRYFCLYHYIMVPLYAS